jgi:hypothetical protein
MPSGAAAPSLQGRIEDASPFGAVPLPVRLVRGERPAPSGLGAGKARRAEGPGSHPGGAAAPTRTKVATLPRACGLAPGVGAEPRSSSTAFRHTALRRLPLGARAEPGGPARLPPRSSKK